MKLSNIVAQLPKDVAVDTFRVELAALIKEKGDGSVSHEYREQIETCMRSYIDRNFEFSSEVSPHLDTPGSEPDIPHASPPKSAGIEKAKSSVSWKRRLVR